MLASQYARKRRLQIRDFFVESDAELILRTLIGETPWGLVFNDGARVVQMSQEEVARLTQAQRSQLLAGVHQRARQGYQFLYSHYPIYSAYFAQRPEATDDFLLFRLFEFLNSVPFLSFAREVTGLDAIQWADAHATLYGPGQFLKYHTDESPTEQRLAAYVINLTKDWGRDWGGYLQFFNDRYDIEEAYRPIFNAINIFTIPADHSVGMVATYCQSSRYSITGWLRGDQPPAAIAAR
jgi:Rps23 Pro-64 3,4-dihydroxylase Tpa1-like proline 4-hydroxylase